MKKGCMLIVAWLLSLTLPAQIESLLACRRFTTQDGLPQMQTEIVWQDSRGYIYIGTLSGFVRYDGRTFTSFLKGKRENIVGFQETGEGVRALGFRRQWLIDGDEVTMRPIDPESKWLLNNFNASDLPNGYVLLEDEREQNRRLCHVTGDGFRIIARGALLEQMTPDRKLWYDGNEIHVPTGNIYSYCRHDSTLYAFGSDGIYITQGRRLTLRTYFHFETPDYGLIVRNLRDGTFIIADAHTIYYYDGHAVHKVRSGFNLIKSMLIDRWHRLWVATYQGAYCFFWQGFTNHRLTDENDVARAIAIDGKGHVVVGTLNGKLIYDGRLISDEPDNFYAPSAVTIGGKAYLADRGGVIAVENGQKTRLPLPEDNYKFLAKNKNRLIVVSRKQIVDYDPTSGHIDTLAIEIRQPWCAASDGEERLWIGSSLGLTCLKGKDIIHRNYKSNLIITAMDSTPQGDVVFATSDSLFAIRNDQVSSLNEQIPELYGHEIRAIHVSPKGTLTIAAIDGLFVTHIDDQCQLSDIRFFNHENGFTLLEAQKATMAEETDGTVWLAGVEQMASFQPEALLLLRQEETYIPAPLRWYEHWWVWLTALLLLAGGIWLLALWYEKRRNQKKLLRLQRAKKEKELQVSAIRLKAIPHFHANVLAAIEYFVMNNSAEEAAKYLKLYSDFTNETLQNIDQPARTVGEETEYIRKYLELEKLRYGERLQYDISIAHDVNRQALLPTMLLHTYCQNAIKHGISHKPDGGKVYVIITRHKDNTIVTVEDTGIGRKAAKRLSKDTTKQGLRILHEQIQLYNKSNSSHIKERVSDLKDEEGHVAGTKYQLTIPEGFNFN